MDIAVLLMRITIGWSTLTGELKIQIFERCFIKFQIVSNKYWAVYNIVSSISDMCSDFFLFFEFVIEVSEFGIGIQFHEQLICINKSITCFHQFVWWIFSMNFFSVWSVQKQNKLLNSPFFFLSLPLEKEIC